MFKDVAIYDHIFGYLSNIIKKFRYVNISYLKKSFIPILFQTESQLSGVIDHGMASVPLKGAL